MPGSGSETPAVRASDDEREAVVVRLQTAAGEGRLTLDELADRLDRALTAVTRAELEPLTTVEVSGLAVMGGNDLLLEGRPPPAPGAPVVRVRAYSVMGGTDVKVSRTPCPLS
jgi:Domain of unknown function (DUF1707)